MLPHARVGRAVRGPLVQRPAAETSGPEPELTFTQEGKDLVAFLTTVPHRTLRLRGKIAAGRVQNIARLRPLPCLPSPATSIQPAPPLATRWAPPSFRHPAHREEPRLRPGASALESQPVFLTRNPRHFEASVALLLLSPAVLALGASSNRKSHPMVECRLGTVD